MKGGHPERPKFKEHNPNPPAKKKKWEKETKLKHTKKYERLVRKKTKGERKVMGPLNHVSCKGYIKNWSPFLINALGGGGRKRPKRKIRNPRKLEYTILSLNPGP